MSGVECSHGILSSPFSGSSLVFRLVSLVDLSDLWHQRIIWVGVSQQGADGEENLGDGKGWRPLFLEDIEANGAIGVDVRVIDSRCEVDLWWLEGVVGWEVDVKEEYTTGIW